MDFMQALNVTIYGLGIVFLSLLILMFAIMVLSKVFSVATGRDILVAPGVAPAAPAVQAAPVATAPAAPLAAEAVSIEQVYAPLPGKILSIAVKAGDAVRKGDEVCVIEAMKMGNSIKSDYEGVVKDVLVSPGATVGFGAVLVAIATAAPVAAPRQLAAAAPAAAPAAPIPAVLAPFPSAFKMGIGGKQYKVDVKAANGGALTVAIDGVSFQVQRDRADSRKVVVNGKAHTVEIKEITGSAVSVVIDGVAQKVEIQREAAAPVPAPVKLKMGVSGKQHVVDVKPAANGDATVVVDGTTYQVQRDRVDGKKVIVNGKAYSVDVKEVSGSAAVVVIDGALHRIELSRDAAPASAPTAAPTPAQSVSAPPPAPISAPAAPRAPAAGEQITAPLPGKILSVAAKVGDAVRKGDELCVIEAMKMGNSIKAQRDGTVRDVLVSPGQAVQFGAPLFVMD